MGERVGERIGQRHPEAILSHPHICFGSTVHFPDSKFIIDPKFFFYKKQKSPVEIRVGNEKEAGKNEACGCGPTITSKASKLVVKCSGLKGKKVVLG